MNCPRLIEGIDYKAKGKWPVVTMRNIAAIHHDLGAIYRFYSGEQCLAHHYSGTTIIHPGYACDGYSPVITAFGKFIRLTPTPKSGMFPAIWHDFSRQFLPVAGCPWDREQTDHWFYDANVKGGVNPHVAGIYYGAVAGPIGSAFIHITRKTDPDLWIEKINIPAS